MPSILFVCTANICRSPMAQALWRERVRQEPQSWRVESAGTWAMQGQPAAEKTRLVLQARGLRLDDHRSRPVSVDLLSDFNLILTMESGHKEAMRIEFPQFADRIFLITEMIGRRSDVRDPVGGSLEDYEDTARELEAIFTLGGERIRRLAAD